MNQVSVDRAVLRACIELSEGPKRAQFEGRLCALEATAHGTFDASEAPLDLVKATAILNRLVGNPQGDELRQVFVEVIAAARPELAERASVESLDWLRAHYDELEYPRERPRDDPSWLDKLLGRSPTADARELKESEVLRGGQVCRCDARACVCRRLPPTRPVPDGEKTFDSGKESPMSHSPVSDARDEVARRVPLWQRPLERSKQHPIFDAAQKPSALVAQLQELIGVAKREGMKLEDLLEALERLAEFQTDDAPTLDAIDGPVAAARAEVNSRVPAWQQPLAMSKGTRR